MLLLQVSHSLELVLSLKSSHDLELSQLLYLNHKIWGNHASLKWSQWTWVLNDSKEVTRDSSEGGNEAQ